MEVMKRARQQAISEVVRRRSIHTQEELVEALQDAHGLEGGDREQRRPVHAVHEDADALGRHAGARVVVGDAHAKSHLLGTP